MKGQKNLQLNPNNIPHCHFLFLFCFPSLTLHPHCRTPSTTTTIFIVTHFTTITTTLWLPFIVCVVSLPQPPLVSSPFHLPHHHISPLQQGDVLRSWKVLLFTLVRHWWQWFWVHRCSSSLLEISYSWRHCSNWSKSY